MSVPRMKYPWIRNPSARSRQIPRERRFTLEQLENRTSLSGGLDFAVNLAPAAIDNSSAIVTSAVAKTDARVQLDSGNTNSGAATGGADSQTSQQTDSVNAGPTAQVHDPTSGTSDPTSAGGDSNQSSPGSGTGSSQGGSDGVTSSSPDVTYAPAAPPPDVNQVDFNPGLLDPLAWTVDESEDQPAAFISDSLEDQQPLISAAGAGPSTLMDRPDEVAIGGAPDSRSIAKWSDDSLAMALNPDFAGARRDPLTVDALYGSIAAETIAWRRFASDLGRSEKTRSNDNGHIAELSPLGRSASLALAATLWAAPAHTRSGQEPATTQTGQAKAHLDASPSASSWKGFVMGLDQAFEKSCDDVRRGLSAETEAAALSQNHERQPADRVQWHGAILPAARGPAIEPESKTSPTVSDGPAAGDAGSFVPAVIQLGEFFLENLVNPVLGHEHGSNGNSQ